ncbi:hypothetical protein E5676_scaffold968G00050 [Cucumis melo var. makuwa]|uniref:Uncharacterized protein n=1 Tax=Cucumis melo var. makuwa TaxID=1194695 RepID=A0A5D3BXB9_CUCMM|nr:hypothetical protein E5676_scaffold968G00050 [Cucumis melo var. makuwa]
MPSSTANNPPKRGKIKAKIGEDLATSAATAASYVVAALAGLIPDRPPPNHGPPCQGHTCPRTSAAQSCLKVTIVTSGIRAKSAN